ncbi:phosphatase PAP2 family protein [Pontibacter sp. SGAir0037]|uniref:phosphatase PAP2 family protein n=1 Tax=Pontibacter sp. SGAir0037 TaxID=2571030 RepID=UPI0010CCB3CD|nr:phosphatase PAP2 family protein [Pontibacter sp. SGAir0037]QCR24235.1 phosphoesterase [Pontibacter sp. SGAir0037]
MINILSNKIRQYIQELRQQSEVQKFSKRFPRVADFIFQRFQTRSFTGLPLTLLLLGCMINLALLSRITEDVVQSEGIVVVDKHFTAFLYDARTGWLSKALYIITQFGSRASTYIVGALVTAMALYRRSYAFILAFWLTMAVVGLSVQYTKKYISRDRPVDVGYYEEPNFSFPSGHATTAIAQYGIVAHLLLQVFRDRWKRRVVLWLMAVLIIAIGFSRIYLGVHFLSDVLAGFLLGGMWLLTGISLIEIISFKYRESS